MPAVAQISVNFAQLSQIRSNKITAPTNVRVVSPRTLTQYLLNNREQGDTVLSSPEYLNYQGGFISAGNKVNVKHDSDLQLRQNLDVEQRVFTDSIFARRKGNTAETYKDSRSSTAVRSITLAPYETDLTANSISITTTPSSKNIGLFMNFGNQGENSITLNNTTNDKKLNVRTGAFRIDAADLDIYGAPVYIDETVEIKKETTITDNLNVTGNLSLGTTSYNKFTIASATGNVAFTGNLNINTGKFTVASASGNTVIAGTLNVSGNTSITGNLSLGTTPYNKFTIASATGNVDFTGNLNINTGKFTVASASGNTVIAGTLNVSGNTSIGGTTTLSNSITIGTGDTTSATRRIIGVRRLVNIAEFNTSTYDNDVLSVGDFKIFAFKTGMIMMWSGSIVNIPIGWDLCDGQNGTPDLRDRFIVGAGNTHAVGATGGADTVTLTTNQIPAHNHSITDPGHRHSVTNYAGVDQNNLRIDSRTINAQSGTLTTRSTTGITINNTGGGEAHENRPPYYALAFIIKV